MDGQNRRADQCEKDFEAEALRSFEQLVVEMKDPRRPQGCRYPLVLVVVSALIAMVCGMDSAEGMAAWCAARAEWLGTFLPMPHSTPTQDVYLRVFATLDPKEFREVFNAWARLILCRLPQSGSHVALDGKTSRGTRDSESKRMGIHTVGAWISEMGLLIGNTHVEEKTNEVAAFLELVGMLNIKGMTVTIDAMGCQREVAAKIVEKGADYLIPVKENQPTLLKDLKATFEYAQNDQSLSIDRSQASPIETFEAPDKGHGRVEVRRVLVCHNLSLITRAKDWAKLAFIAMVVRERTVLSTNKTSTEVLYYIGSNPNASAEEIFGLIRSHWSIENGCHWILDVAFREDHARQRSKSAGKNFSLMRRFALTLLKLDKTARVGVAAKRVLAATSTDYLIHILSGARHLEAAV